MELPFIRNGKGSVHTWPSRYSILWRNKARLQVPGHCCRRMGEIAHWFHGCIRLEHSAFSISLALHNASHRGALYLYHHHGRGFSHIRGKDGSNKDLRTTSATIQCIVLYTYPYAQTHTRTPGEHTRQSQQSLQRTHKEWQGHWEDANATIKPTKLVAASTTAEHLQSLLNLRF